MSGFYGGRDGRSFLIVKDFESVAAMAKAFDDPAYTEVNFDEYVLINTLNKNNPENGQIYRRGYDYTSDRKIASYTLTKKNDEEGNIIITYTSDQIDANGAVYVGTIVGPAGRAPMFEFGHYDDIRIIDKAAKYLNVTFDTIEKIAEYFNGIYSNGAAKYDEDGDLLVSNPEKDFAGQTNFIKTNKIDSEEIYYFHYDSIYADKNNSIGWYLVETPRIGEGAYSFDHDLVPGVEYETDEDGNYIYEEIDGVKNLKIKTDSYQKTINWKYCSVRNENNEDSTAYIGFRFVSPVIEFEATPTSAYETVDLIDKLSVDMNKESITDHPFYSRWKLKIPKGIKGNSLSNLRVSTLITKGEYYNPDGNKYTVSDTTHDFILYDEYTYDNKAEGELIKTYVLGKYDQIKSITLAEDGTLTIERTHGKDEFKKQFHWITDVSFDNYGTVKLTFNNDKFFNNGELIKENLIKWISNVSIDDAGNLKIEFNNGADPIERTLTWISAASYENGMLNITFNNNSVVQNISKEIKGIEDISIGEDQKLTFTYNTGASKTFEEPLNYIEEVKRDSDSESDTYNHLLIKHSDPVRGWQDLGGLNYTMVADEIFIDDESTEEEIAQSNILEKKKADLSLGGVWFVSKEIPAIAEEEVPKEPLPEEGV